MSRKTRGRVCAWTLCAAILLAWAGFGACETKSASPEDLFAHNSTEFSKELALYGIELLSSASVSALRASLAETGARAIRLVNFEKDKSDKRHTCSFLMAQTPVTVRGRARNLITVCICASHAGEWFANFDFVPSRDPDPEYLENFYMAAQNAAKYVSEFADLYEDPLLFVCGSSRGGSCANVLGVLLDRLYGQENVYAYTYCASSTVKRERFQGYDNIFNLVNPADVVSYLPAPCWGFGRAGVDVVTDASPALIERAQAYAALLDAIAPTISEYYEKAYPVNGAKIGASALSAYEFAQYFAHLYGHWPQNAARAKYHLRLLAAADTPFDALIEGAMTFDAAGNAAPTDLFSQHRLDLFVSQIESLP